MMNPEIRRNQKHVWIGSFLLFVSFLIGCVPLYLDPFGDEGDKIAVGKLITQGYLLYKDVFSHHFPLPYFWSAGVLAIFGDSITALRLSILLLQVCVFGIVIVFSRTPIVIGAISVLWSVLRFLYLGQLVLYNTFSALGLLLVFLSMMAIILGQAQRLWVAWLALIVGASLAIFSDPLALLPVFFAFLILSCSRQFWKGAAISISVLGGIVLSITLLFVVFGTLDDFYRDAIRFNIDVYSRYYNIRTERLTALIPLALSGLRIFQPDVWQRPESLGIGAVTSFDIWFFGGFAFRCGILLAFVQLLVSGRYRAALAVYLFAVGLLLRSEVSFRAMPAALNGYAVAVLAASMSLLPPQLQAGSRIIAIRTVVTKTSVIIATILISVILVRGSMLLYSQRERLSYEANFGGYETLLQELNVWSCERSVRLMYYPSDPYVHFFSNFRPVSRYIFFYPWIADVGTEETLAALQAGNTELTLIVVERTGSVWGRPNAVYMKPLLNYLDKSYVSVTGNVFRSVALQEACDAVQ